MKPTKQNGRPRIEDKKPLAVTKGLRALVDTGDVKAAAEIAGCSTRTIIRMLNRPDRGFDEVKKAVAARALHLSAAAQEVAAQKVGELSGMQAFIAAKISSQQAGELLAPVHGPFVQINIVAEINASRQRAEELRAKLAELEAAGDGN